MFLKLFVDLQNRFAEVQSRQQEGQALVEYALILFLVSIVAIVVLKAIGTNVNVVFGKVRDALT